MNDRIAKLERLLASDERDAFVLYGLAQEHGKVGDTARAVAFYDRCLEADPKYLYAYYHKAKTLADAGREEEAGVVLRRGLEQAKIAGDAKATNELAALLDQVG